MVNLSTADVPSRLTGEDRSVWRGPLLRSLIRMHVILGEDGADAAIQKRFDVTQQKDEVETQAGDSGRGRWGKHAYRPLGAEREARVGQYAFSHG